MFRSILLATLLVPLLPLAAAAQQQYLETGSCPAGSVRLQPVTETHTIPPYPTLSQRLGEQGASQLKVTIDPVSGTPIDIEIYRSSGSVRLDDAAAQFVKANWKWSITETGCSSPVTTLVTIAWNLKNPPISWGVELTMTEKDFPPGARNVKEQGTSVISLALDEEGRVNAFGVASSSGFPDLDAKAQQIVRTHRWTGAQMDGKGVKTAVFVIVHWPAP